MAVLGSDFVLGAAVLGGSTDDGGGGGGGGDGTAPGLGNVSHGFTVGQAPTLTISHTVEADANGLLVLAGGYDYFVEITGVTWGGVPLLRVGSGSQQVGVCHASAWYLPNPTPGTDDVVITGSVSRWYSAGVYSVIGSDHQISHAAITAGAYTQLELDSSTASLVVDHCFNTEAGVSFQAAPGQTSLWEEEPTVAGNNNSAGSWKPGAASSTVMAWTLTGGFILGVEHAAVIGLSEPEVPPDPEPPEPGGEIDAGVNPPTAVVPTGSLRLFFEVRDEDGDLLASAETPLRDPSTWHGGFKPATLIEVSDFSLVLSTDLQGIDLTVKVDDEVLTWHTKAAAETIGGAFGALYVVSDEVRYALGEPHRLFAGRINNHGAEEPFVYWFSLRDVVSELMADLDAVPMLPPGVLDPLLFPGMDPSYDGRSTPMAIGLLSDASEPVPQGVAPPLVVARGLNLQTAFGGVNRNVIVALWTQGAAGLIDQVFYNPAVTWKGEFAVPASMSVRPTPEKATGFRYTAIVAGTTGTSEPTWPTAAGGTVVDGSVLWQRGDVDDPDLRVTVPDSFWGAGGWTPGKAGWADTGIPTNYVDYPAGDPRRYTPLFIIDDGSPYSVAFWENALRVAANLYGLAENADGTGRYYSDPPRVLLRLLSFIFAGGYQTTYPPLPTMDGVYSAVNTDLIERTVARQHAARAGGFPIGMLLGADGGRKAYRNVAKEVCEYSDMQQGFDRHGRWFVDTEDIAADPVCRLSDLLDILEGGFKVWIDRSQWWVEALYQYGLRYIEPSAPRATRARGEPMPARTAPYNPFASGVQRLTHAPAIAKIPAGTARKQPFRWDNTMVRDGAVAAAILGRMSNRAAGPAPSYDGPRMFSLPVAWPKALQVELGDNVLIDHVEGLGQTGYEGQLARVMKITHHPQQMKSTLEGYLLFPS